MASKKKLYKLNPARDIQPVIVQSTKRESRPASVTEQSNERNVRELLSNKVCGTHMGLWLLVPEYLRLGAWDLLNGCFGKSAGNHLDARIALQLVNESALCVNRVRKKDSLCNQGFSLVNGLHFLVTDETVHDLLGKHPVQTYEQLQITLMQLRRLQKHYSDDKLILALDPHRVKSATQRMMPRKKKCPDEPAHKMMQTFFCVDTSNGQPLAFVTGSSGKNCSPVPHVRDSIIEYD